MLAQLKETRKARGISQVQAAADLGVPLGTYRNWEQCRNMPQDLDTFLHLASYFGVEVSDLIDEPLIVAEHERISDGFDANSVSPKPRRRIISPSSSSASKAFPKDALIPRSIETTSIPCYGCIAAGAAVEMCEVIEEVEAPLSKKEQYPSAYFLTVVGDSMNNEVLDGSLVLIDPKAEVHNGDTVAVNISGCDVMLKVWHRTSNSIILSPNSTNPEHKDIILDEASSDAGKLRLLGKKVWAMYPDK